MLVMMMVMTMMPMTIEVVVIGIGRVIDDNGAGGSRHQAPWGVIVHALVRTQMEG